MIAASKVRAATATPYGFCHCGCGELAPLATQNRPERGQVKGRPVLYIRGHNNNGTSELGFDAYDLLDLGYATPCWIYRRAPGGDGYAQMRTPDGTQQKASRAFFEHHCGRIAPGMTLDHLCHTHTSACPGGRTCPHRRCVNPSHLEPVERGENRRRARFVTLDDAKVRDIKYLLSAGWHTDGIASAYGVTRTAINHIKRGTTWAHV